MLREGEIVEMDREQACRYLLGAAYKAKDDDNAIALYGGSVFLESKK